MVSIVQNQRILQLKAGLIMEKRRNRYALLIFTTYQRNSRCLCAKNKEGVIVRRRHRVKKAQKHAECTRISSKRMTMTFSRVLLKVETIQRIDTWVFLYKTTKPIASLK